MAFRSRARGSLRWLPPLLALALPAAGCRAESPPGAGAEPACRAGSPIEVDLDAWRRALEAVPGWPMDDRRAAGPDRAPDYRPLLRELGLAPLPDRRSEDGEPGGGVMTLASVEIFDLRRGGGTAPDRLIAARFRNARGAESLRAAVLRPLGEGGVYCPLGHDLSHDKERGEEPCLEEHRGPARTLGLEPLVAPDRDAVVVRDAGGSCGPGMRRGDRFVTSYWGIEEGRLVRYFEGVTAEAWYVSPGPPEEIRRGEIELSESWPRALTFAETVECFSERDDDDGGCTPRERVTIYRYTGNDYVAVDPPSAAAGVAGEASEEP